MMKSLLSLLLPKNVSNANNGVGWDGTGQRWCHGWPWTVWKGFEQKIMTSSTRGSRMADGVL
jgi:hypothetical protein